MRNDTTTEFIKPRQDAYIRVLKVAPGSSPSPGAISADERLSLLGRAFAGRKRRSRVHGHGDRLRPLAIFLLRQQRRMLISLTSSAAWR